MAFTLGTMTGSLESLAVAFDTQSAHCKALGSSLYAHLCAEAAADVRASGPVLRALLDVDAEVSGVPLTLLAAVHRLALEGRAPAVAAHYPSADGDGNPAGAWLAFRDLLASKTELVRATFAETTVQTNEPRRSAALLGGFIEASRRGGLPLRLLEIGTSAGLNLRFDHYRYEIDGEWWGPESSAVELRSCFTNPPPLHGPVRVASRHGCDLNPIDPTTSQGRLRLRSMIWPDQNERFALLDAAVAVARAVPAEVTREPAQAWLASRLKLPATGVTTVVYHSLVTAWMTAQDQQAVDGTIAEAGQRATVDAPLTRIWMEPAGSQAEIRMFWWPGGSDTVLGYADYHGTGVRWA